MARNRSAAHTIRFMALATAASLALIPAVACAQPAPRSDVNIRSQSLGSALTQVGRQTRTEIIFSPSAVQGKTAPAVQGRLSADQATERLLAGSGLTVRQTSSGALVV